MVKHTDLSDVVHVIYGFISALTYVVSDTACLGLTLIYIAYQFLQKEDPWEKLTDMGELSLGLAAGFITISILKLIVKIY